MSLGCTLRILYLYDGTSEVGYSHFTPRGTKGLKYYGEELPLLRVFQFPLLPEDQLAGMSHQDIVEGTEKLLDSINVAYL